MKYLVSVAEQPEIEVDAEDTRRAAIDYIKKLDLKDAVVTVKGMGIPVKWYVNEYSEGNSFT